MPSDNFQNESPLDLARLFHSKNFLALISESPFTCRSLMIFWKSLKRTKPAMPQGDSHVKTGEKPELLGQMHFYCPSRFQDRHRASAKSFASSNFSRKSASNGRRDTKENHMNGAEPTKKLRFHPYYRRAFKEYSIASSVRFGCFNCSVWSFNYSPGVLPWRLVENAFAQKVSIWRLSTYLGDFFSWRWNDRRKHLKA